MSASDGGDPRRGGDLGEASAERGTPASDGDGRPGEHLASAGPAGGRAGSAHEARMALEAILFLSDEPMTATVLAQAVERSRREVEAFLAALAREYETRGAGIVLRQVAGGWRLFTNPEAAPYVEQFVLASRHSRLTRAALETLAIVAYKQPVTRHQISGIRGANSDGVLRALVDRGLVQEVGRDEGPGRAALFGTTPEFLERLGLASLSDLPPLAPLLAEAGAEAGAGAEG